MNDVILVTDTLEAEILQTTINKVMGYPMRGTHVGDGRHIDIVDEWDGKGELPLGWCKNYVEIYDAELEQQIALPIAENDATELLSKLDMLDQQESRILSSALATRTTIDLEAKEYKPRDIGKITEVADIDMRDESTSIKK
jgi:hypothetical protein